ncbi:electron transfer flavoprotein-associated cytochrome b and CCG domain pair iron-sulfur cluster-binding oxidoreductase [Citrifermentans bemidjiense Bem]|uniref:Electron transfer flavoprotein-associated cytochrome b and CCG domain pair iron-sulfur cluster-binding oxidoreductase n=1 Tax=Citrifermentans bemidjiense (strain ATCC BAA-1014 / DSM 16622 / JCM 12645 / Bem) TaxID=404380 RepID=B5E7V0_CITBB|nr:(Fe-S)-binding protein [Citrifermentans bemidjiense]ACH38486.1 electron transfer flavoprotein-associated cytochrome b and CCG domain pair iron-sulfur cluster-binding oxidoreductase [Citrifermentans bemidjiense Bem]
MPSTQIYFMPLFIIALVAFCFSCYQRLQLVAVGTSEDRFDRPGERLAGMFRYAFGQERVLARPYGLNHFALFWAFMLLLVANVSFLAEGLFPGFTLSALPAPLHHALGLAFDLVSVVALVSVAVALTRRLFFAPSYLGNDYTKACSGEALLILALIATLMVAFFLLNAAQIALGAEQTLRPVSGALATLLRGMPQASLEAIASASWWVHAVVLLLFMNLLPRSKHMHILTAIPNCYFRNLEKPNVQPRESFELGKRFGVSEVAQFSWKDLLDSFSCTECGRCQDLCPAHNTGKPLNPRRIIHDIKVNLLENGVANAGKQQLPLIGEKAEGTSCEDALWSCTTCGACLSVCPVLIEHMPKIVKMRRHLVQEKARFPEELLNLFENMEQRSNPWGIAPSERGKWATLLGDREFTAGKTEYLFFVGCAGSFDSRAKQTTVALATVLDKAGVTWGILGREELCCGDSVRRLGNEFVFDRMARENVAKFKEKGVTKIVTQCPHCFSTLKNDYRQYGLELEVLHHSELIARLVQEGKLPAAKGVNLGKTLFHDSCYLGRHNDTFDAPRQVIEAATGAAPGEFERQKENGFCCGAGGGRMWMEEQIGTRINHDRVNEALKQQPDTICVSCPYCMTMLEDGLKDQGAEKVRVKDIAEVMAEAIN